MKTKARCWYEVEREGRRFRVVAKRGQAMATIAAGDWAEEPAGGMHADAAATAFLWHEGRTFAAFSEDGPTPPTILCDQVVELRQTNLLNGAMGVRLATGDAVDVGEEGVVIGATGGDDQPGEVSTRECWFRRPSFLTDGEGEKT